MNLVYAVSKYSNLILFRCACRKDLDKMNTNAIFFLEGKCTKIINIQSRIKLINLFTRNNLIEGVNIDAWFFLPSFLDVSYSILS